MSPSRLMINKEVKACLNQLFKIQSCKQGNNQMPSVVRLVQIYNYGNFNIDLWQWSIVGVFVSVCKKRFTYHVCKSSKMNPSCGTCNKSFQLAQIGFWSICPTKHRFAIIFIELEENKTQIRKLKFKSHQIDTWREALWWQVPSWRMNSQQQGTLEVWLHKEITQERGQARQQPFSPWAGCVNDCGHPSQI